MSKRLKRKMETFERTLQDFSFKVANKLHSQGKNMVYSPSSLSFAMGMLLEGTDGQSRKEIMTAFFDPKFNDDPAHVELASTFLTKLVNGGHPDGIQKLLTVANFCYSQQNFKLHPSYLSTIQQKYRAVGRELDFMGNNRAALEAINGDVEKVTKGLIPSLLDQVPADTKAVLVNAIHFKGLWQIPFKKTNTTTENFTLSNGQVVKVPTMGFTKSIEYCRDSKNRDVKFLKLRYECGAADEKVYMVCILPKMGQLKAYLENFNVEDFNETLNECYRENTVVKLPRFKISNTHVLSSTIKQLGIGHIFSGEANLSKMCEAGQLQVSDILQKAVIEVDEEGTTAAAATAIMMRMCAMMDPPPTFIADHPFIYALVSETKDSKRHIIFLGVVENPLE